jgi:murein DD-endopeptidase MepM/ murein hydrolase activator NlpD
MRILTLLMVLLVAPPAQAVVKVLHGAFEQGGFVMAETTPGAKVRLGNEEVPVDETGLFAVGFTRDQKSPARLMVTLPDGTRKKFEWKLKKRTYKVQKITGVDQKYVEPPPEVMARIEADAKKINAAREVFEPLPFLRESFAWPASGTLTGFYGSARWFNGKERSWHKGLDIANVTGTPVYAANGGIVRLALPDSYFNGNVVLIDHGHQIVTLYSHLDSLTVRDGQAVKRGQKIGTIGSTGRSTGPHLHLGLYWRKLPLDPRLLLKGAPQ